MAKYENKTVEEVRDLIINAVKSKFNLAFRLLPKSFLFTASTVLAGVFIILYKQIAWVFLQLFPGSAYWRTVYVLGIPIRPLIKWGVLIGVGEPRTGTQWKGNIIVNVLSTGTLIAGTQLKSNVTGLLYITLESVPLEGTTVTVSAVCAETGSAGNLESGDTLSFVSPLGNVQKTTVAGTVTSYAGDDETETEYRARVERRFRSPPLGGAISDYQIWSGDVAGVLSAYPYKDPNSAAGVLVFVAGVPSQFFRRIPTSNLLRQVGEACTYDPETGRPSRKPVTAVLDPALDGSYENIRPVAIKEYTVRVYGMNGVPVSDFANAVRPALEDYFFGREPYIRGLSDDNNKLNIISKNNITSVVDQTSLSLKAEFDSVKLFIENTEIASDTLGMGELAELLLLYVNGEAV